MNRKQIIILVIVIVALLLLVWLFSATTTTKSVVGATGAGNTGAATTGGSSSGTTLGTIVEALSGAAALAGIGVGVAKLFGSSTTSTNFDTDDDTDDDLTDTQGFDNEIAGQDDGTIDFSGTNSLIIDPTDATGDVSDVANDSAGFDIL